MKLEKRIWIEEEETNGENGIKESGKIKSKIQNFLKHQMFVQTQAHRYILQGAPKLKMDNWKLLLNSIMRPINGGIARLHLNNQIIIWCYYKTRFMATNILSKTSLYTIALKS